MRLKPGVKLAGLVPQMAIAATVVRDAYADFKCEPTITSCNDSKHGVDSLHFVGRALDFRTHDFTGDKQLLLAELKTDLGSNFDVLLEDPGGANEHIHVEYDPK